MDRCDDQIVLSNSTKKSIKFKNLIKVEWGRMPYDVLLKIFTSLNEMELILVASRVCSYWRLACCDPSLSNTLDLRVVTEYFKVPRQMNAWLDSYSSVKLSIILKNVFTLSNGSITNWIFDFYICITEQHLARTAESCPNLRRLVLPVSYQITTEGFRAAFEHWKSLESILVPRIINDHRDLIESIGEFCDNLKELKIMCRVNLGLATCLSSCLPNLKVLSLRCSVIYRDALLHILDNMKNLEVLNITHCLMVNLTFPFAPVFVYRDFDSQVVEKASRLREFYTCRRDSCAFCRRPTHERGILIWHDYVEDLFRVDEIASLAC